MTRCSLGEPTSERPVAVTQRSSARYRHWPFRCCSSPYAYGYHLAWESRQLVPEHSGCGHHLLYDDPVVYGLLVSHHGYLLR